CLVFGLPFGAVGLFSAWGLLSTFQNSSETSDWIKVKADVVSAKLEESRGRKSTTYRAVVAYRYVVDGKTYVGNRVSLTGFGGADNVGDYQREIASHLID